MGLDIGVFCVIEGLHTVNCKLLYLVHYLAAAVIAFAGIAFCVFIGAYGAHCRKDFVGYVVFRRNEFKPCGLTLLLLLDQLKKLYVFFHVVFVIGLQI